MRRRRLALLLIAPVGFAFVGATGAWSAARPQVAGGPQLTSFDAVAGADGVRVLVEVPSAPLSSNVFDGGVPVTQALVNGIGESRLASVPYPGDTLLTTPGLVFPLVGLPAPPDYPLIVSSAAPNKPKAAVDYGVLHITARSDAVSSAVDASGGGGSGASAIGRFATAVTATADRKAARVTSKAESTTEVVSIGGVLSIGRVHAVAEVRRPAAGKATTTSSLEIDGLRAAGTAIGVTSNGFVLPGSNQPVPDSAGLSPVLDAAGISLQYVKAQPIAGGIVSAALAITLKGSTAPANGSVTYILGRVRAIATATVGDAVTLPVDAGIGGAIVTPPQSPAAEPGAGGAVAETSAATDAGSSAAPGAGTASPTAETAARPATDAATRTAAVRGSTVSTTSFYLVLVIGALVGVVGGVLVRLFGMRLRWSS